VSEPITIKLLRGLRRSTACAMLGLFAMCAAAAAQGGPDQVSPNPSPSAACARLVGQLAAFDSGGDAGRNDQIRRAEDAVTKQQEDLDRAVAQAHKAGCAGQGFFALFSGLSPQCGPITSQIQQIRGNLDRMISDLEKLKSGNDDRDGQRRAIIGQLAQNNCGPQYASAGPSGPRGFFDTLFGGTLVNPAGDGAPSGTYHTVCVRTCDGYYFPISYSTMPNRFAEDERMCQRLCPAAQAALYAFRNPGEDMNAAVSTSGAPYTALPTAFNYRKMVTPGCSCRQAGQSWGEALRNADDASTLVNGDIVVTDQKAKALSQVPQTAAGKAVKNGAVQPDPKAATQAPAPTPAANTTDSDPAKRKVRAVGPPFMSAQ
jgi:hypothetical protein